MPSYEQLFESHLVNVVKDLLSESAEEHPFHKAAIEAGLTHNYTHTKGSKTIHNYLPDHHWKSGVQLHTTKHKGRLDKHEWRSNNMASGHDVESLKTYLKNDQTGYDRMVQHHKAGTGPFKS